MTNSTYSHVNMNNKKDNSFSDFISKKEDDSNTSRGVNNITHNILSSRGSKNVFENKSIARIVLFFAPDVIACGIVCERFGVIFPFRFA